MTATPAPSERRERVARRLLWAAVFCAFIYSTARTSFEVQSASLGLFDVVRGGGPVLLFLVGCLVAPTRPRRFGGVEFGVTMFLMVAVASSAWSIAPTATLLKTVPLVASYLALLRLVRLYPDVETAIRGLAVMVHALLIWTAAQAIVVPEMVLIPDGPYSTVLRLNSAAPQMSPNPLALVAVAGILAVVLRVGPHWITRSLPTQVLLVGVYFAELLATRTRTALAVGAVLVVGAALAQVRTRPALVIHSTLAGLAVALWAWTPARVDAVQQFIARGQDSLAASTLTGRTLFWDIALREWREEPILGLGYYTGHRLGLPGLAETQSNIDSTWIELLVDVGLLGTVPLAVAVALGLRCVLRVSAPRPEKVWLAAVTLGGVLVSFVNPTVQSPGVGMILLAFPLLAAAAFLGSGPGGILPARAVRPNRLVERGVVVVGPVAHFGRGGAGRRGPALAPHNRSGP